MELDETLLVSTQQLDALPALAPLLLEWYDRSARKLPWRDEPTPYRVWVSEIMLQQTRVEAVRGYFERFMQALPTVEALAAVPEDALLKLWEGLGYYNRTRNLQRTARMLAADYGGRLPASYAQLLELVGIGEYTAGAIASIAFGIPVPAVDGNVYRVLSRLLASYADTSLPPVKHGFRAAAAAMLPEGRPGDFNQSLMELGATVCLPNAAPLCTDCPVAKHCEAYKNGCALELPVKAAKKARRMEQRTVVVVVAEGKTLLSKRQGRGLLAGMFQPVNVDGHLSAREAGLLVEQLGGTVRTVEPLGDAKHLFTHIEWQMTGYVVICAPFAPPEGSVWADAAALTDSYALPSAFRAYTAQLPRWLSGL